MPLGWKSPRSSRPSQTGKRPATSSASKNGGSAPGRHPDRGGSAYLAGHRRSASASTEPRRLNGSPLAPITQCLLQRDGMIPLLNRIVERIERDRTTDGTLEGERKQ